MDKNIKFKVSDNSYRKNDSEILIIAIAYSAKKIETSQASYEIISALKAEDNIIIEINSSLLRLSQADNKNLNSKLIDSLESMGIEYQNKKISVNAKRTLLSIAIESKKVEGFELYAAIPHSVWCNQEFKKIIPDIGVRYYLLKPNTEYDLNSFTKLEYDEKFEQCRMVIYDNIIFGSMGINTSIYKKDDIIELLGK